MSLTRAERLAAEPFTAALSAGFFGFFAHAGALAALEERGLAPARVTGASSGAVIAGAWASGLDASPLREKLLALRRADIWDPMWGFGPIRGRKIEALVRTMFPVWRFEDCRVPCAVVACDWLRRPHAFTSGDMALPIVASCAVPLLFRSVRIDGRRWIDGGVRDPLALSAAPTEGLTLSIRLSGPEVARANTDVVSLTDLPRPGPRALDRGSAAWEAARMKMHAALDEISEIT